LEDLAAMDLSYAPPYSPVYDPLIVAAQAAQLEGVA
jgi:CoA-dependent NAD(P)H sulfur oxidoreductase